MVFIPPLFLPVFLLVPLKFAESVVDQIISGHGVIGGDRKTFIIIASRKPINNSKVSGDSDVIELAFQFD